MLTREQKARFRRDGYLHLPGLVPRAPIEQALRLINADLGKGIDPGQLPSFVHRSFCPSLRRAPEILGLFESTAAKRSAEALIGTGALGPLQIAQIALRFPVLEGTGAIGPHIDGSHSPVNGVPAGKLAHYTLLAMVALSDALGDDMGNFRVWPGTHRAYEHYFREHGPECMLAGTPKLDSLPAPRQLRVHAGDVVLAHYQLLHGAANNTSAYPRYAVFFRVYHKDHDEGDLRSLTDLYREYAGLRES